MRGHSAASCVSIFLCLIMAATVSAQSLDTPLLPLKTETPPVIDGVLNDPVWQEAPWESGFKTYSPDYGIAMMEDTKVWYAYDRENLYFAFRCYDSRPDQIKSSINARDNIRPDDWICINLDTFNDQQSLFVFYSNPLGIQMDSRATAVSEDMDIDFVWYSVGQIDEEGYSIELKIPFKSIRFSYREPVEMGIIFERKISRLSQAGTYPPLDPRHGPNFLTQTRTLIFQDIEHYRLVEVLPAATYGTGSAHEQGDWVSGEEESNFGLTAKYGITSHLVLDGTYKPDFSQVESDAGQVDFNQRYALYYPEKRPFFLEGREHFDMGAADDSDPLRSVVHSRMIIAPDVGLKLTGRIGSGNTLAAIYARDVLPEDLGQGEYAQFSILRYKRALSSDSFIGGFYTGRDLEGCFNRVYGADGLIRLNPSSTIGFHAFASQSENDLLSSKSDGRALGFKYKYFTRDWIVECRVHDLSPDFNAEIGYVTRTGITRYRFGALKFIYPESSIILRLGPMVHFIPTRDHLSGKWESYTAFDLAATLSRSSYIRAGYAIADEIFLDKKFKTNGFTLRGNSQITRQLFLSLYYRNGMKIRYVFTPGESFQGRGNDVSTSVVYQHSDHLSASLSWVFSNLVDDRDSERVFDYNIVRNRITYQINRYLFLRSILEYNSFYENLTTDFLVSFTYIPGTVFHVGYGSLYEKLKWDNSQYVVSDSFMETRRGFFVKVSYLWRM